MLRTRRSASTAAACETSTLVNTHSPYLRHWHLRILTSATQLSDQLGPCGTRSSGVIEFIHLRRKRPSSGTREIPYRAQTVGPQGSKLDRSTEAPARPPDHTFLLISKTPNRIEAAFSFFAEELEPGALRIHLSVLARHLDCSGKHFGDLAHARFRMECAVCIESVPSATAAILTAEAHADNLPAQRLLLAHGWQCTGENDSNGYAPWALPIEIV